MKGYIETRVLEVADHIIKTGCTIRSAAGTFGVSKSTIHKDLIERLPKVNPQVFELARNVLEVNKEERNIRGGEATKNKYRHM